MNLLKEFLASLGLMAVVAGVGVVIGITLVALLG